MSKMITYGNKTQSIADWIREGSATPNSVYKRLKDGYDIMSAIHKPMQEQVHTGGTNPTIFAMFEGQKRTVKDISEMTGWSTNTVRHYIHDGKPLVRKPTHIKVVKDKPKPPSYVPNETPEEYQLKNMRLSMSDIEIEAHLMRGMA